MKGMKFALLVGVAAVMAAGSASAQDKLRVGWTSYPADLSVIGVDSEDIALAAQPEITRIVRDFRTIGHTAAGLMLARLRERGRERVTMALPSRLVLAGSCGQA